MIPENEMNAAMAYALSDIEREQAEMELMEGDIEQDQEPPMDEADLIAIVTAELENSRDAYSIIEKNREDALRMYLGNLVGDEDADLSTVVSTDVADSLEWMLPQIIEQLIGKGAVVQFDSMGPQDEEQSELETEFTHFTFMQENQGFVNIYEFSKDALLMKNGVFKIYYDDTPEITSETYTGVTQQEIAVVQNDPTVEIKSIEIEQTMQPDLNMDIGGPPAMMQPQQLSTVRLKRTTKRGKVTVGTVASECFFVNSGHNSITLDDARFTAEVSDRTASDLLKLGYDPEKIANAPQHSADESKEYRFNLQGETTLSNYNSSLDDSQKLIQIIEAYMQLDLDGDGISELAKVTCIGDDYTISDILDVEEISEQPFVAATPWIMPHKFYGLSVYDRVKEIQDGKTSLWRNTLDNIYLQNNREKEVVEKLVNMDDLLLSRPGGLKRVKQAGAIRELEVQPVGNEAMAMMGYFDEVRSARTGVAPDMSGQALPIGQETAHGVERVMTASEALVGLVVRSIAETGLREAYKKVRNLLVRYQDSCTPFKFKDQWIDVNPSQWGERSRMSVTVGTGTGDDMRRQAALQKVIEYQTMLVQDPRNTMVDQQQIYNALNDLADAAGLDSAEKYFLNPNSQEGQQKKQQTEQQQQQQEEQKKQLEQMMQEMQQKIADAEMGKAQAQLQSAQVKAQKAMVDARNQQLEAQIEAAGDAGDLQFKYAQLKSDVAIKLTELEAEHARELSQQHADNVAGKTDDDDDDYDEERDR